MNESLLNTVKDLKAESEELNGRLRETLGLLLLDCFKAFPNDVIRIFMVEGVAMNTCGLLVTSVNVDSPVLNEFNEQIGVFLRMTKGLRLGTLYQDEPIVSLCHDNVSNFIEKSLHIDYNELLAKFEKLELVKYTENSASSVRRTL